MCAMMPMLRTLLRSVSTSSATCEALLLRSGGAVRRLVSPAVVRERPVRLGHLVHVLATLDRGTEAVARVEELVHQALGHGLLATSAREVDQPAQRQRGGPDGAHLDGHLVGGATDSTGPHLEGRPHVLQCALEDDDRVVAGLLPGTLAVSYTHLTLPTIYSV